MGKVAEYYEKQKLANKQTMNNEHGVKQMLGASYIAANLYCICVTTCFMFAKADAVQISGNIRSTQ